MFDAYYFRKSFPIFREKAKPLIYLDNAATTQKPQCVIDAITDFYSSYSANVHRGIYSLAEKATERYETTRRKVKSFINAASETEVVFTKGTTESANLVAQTFLAPTLLPGDEVLITAMEHHSNLLPWQIACKNRKAELVIAPIDYTGDLLMEEFSKLVGPRTKLVAVTHISNTLGTVNPIRDIISIAHERRIPVFVDAAQSIAHTSVDVQALDCDFLAFSAHKMFGPTGTGVLYGKAEHLEVMQPYQLGGEMIRSVSYQDSTFADTPHKFEAGTPNIAGVIGLGAAIDFIENLDRNGARGHLDNLLAYAIRTLKAIDGLKIVGNPRYRSTIISFVLPGIHPHDIATFLNEDSICIRAGHHCTQPLMDFYKLPATARISIGLYNTTEEIDALSAAIRKVISFFS